MPGMYAPGDYDLAGFAVGVVEKRRIIDGSRVRAGDRLIGLASSGAHSNGYSLIRKIVQASEADLSMPFAGRTLGEALLEPTRIYVRPVLALLKQVQAHALAHITGGGITENLPRVLPEGTRALIDAVAWTRPSVFDWLQQQGGIEDAEMHRTFNCGVGMVVCVAADDVERTLDILHEQGEQAWPIGEVASGGAPGVEIR